jgi:hypothetical protein
MANTFDIWLKASIINGTFIIKIKYDNGILVVKTTSSEIPVTPPSINWLGRRNPLSPKLAENIPSIMKKMLLIFSLAAKDIL